MNPPPVDLDALFSDAPPPPAKPRLRLIGTSLIVQVDICTCGAAWRHSPQLASTWARGSDHTTLEYHCGAPPQGWRDLPRTKITLRRRVTVCEHCYARPEFRAHEPLLACGSF
jgi:hypothetical protein